jgi:hypothetical protein
MAMCMLVIQHWGKVVFLLYPFLDLNNNGKKDEGENRIFVKDVKVINGRAMISKETHHKNIRFKFICKL